jgi:hypothetical protein
MSEVSMEDRLERILTRVIDWLKFAEAKNVALLTLDAGAGAGLIGWLGGDQVPPAWLTAALQIALALLVASAIVALLSFLPVVNINWLRQRHRHAQTDSVLFFGQIAGADPDTYLQLLRKAAGVGTGSSPGARLERDYAIQIVINAEIATAKFRLFKAGAWIAVGAVSVVAARAVYHLLG